LTTKFIAILYKMLDSVVSKRVLSELYTSFYYLLLQSVAAIMLLNYYFDQTYSVHVLGQVKEIIRNEIKDKLSPTYREAFD
jgi:hypothetical protein